MRSRLPPVPSRYQAKDGSTPPRISLVFLVGPDLLHIFRLVEPHCYLATVPPVRIQQEIGRPFRLFDLRGQITAFFVRPAPLVLADVDALVVQLQAVATALC